jgi:enhancing lycopene biosynthesis protein 2
MRKVGVVFAGCGYLDGTEIQEAVATLLALSRRGVEVIAMAPNVPQMHVVDHRVHTEAEYTRNVLTEAARITRGDIHDLESVDVQQLDALVFPGGFGAAKNLCDFATAGMDMSVLPVVKAMIIDRFESKTPMAFICIAPVIAASVIGAISPGVELTIGSDVSTAQAIEAFGGRHVCTEPGGIHIDRARRIVSTPAYMVGPDIASVFDGIDACIEALLEMS